MYPLLTYYSFIYIACLLIKTHINISVITCDAYAKYAIKEISI